MAPALTKFLKDGHGIHLSSPPASSERSVCSMDLGSQLRPSEDFQKMLFSVLPPPNSIYLQPNALDLPSNSGVTTGQLESLTHPSPYCLSVSYNSSITESQQLDSMLPAVSDMCVFPEHNGKEGCLKSARPFRPGASDVPPSCSLCRASPFANVDYNSVFAPTIISNQENCRLDQLVPGLQLQNQIKKRALRQTGLYSRSQRLRRRLQALLGQHASLHCNQQLEGLRKQGSDLRGFSAGAELSQAECEQHFTLPETSTHFTEIKEFSQSSHAVLKGLQEALDSEATASSSSDDEPVESKTPGEYRVPNVVSPCFERRWLLQRAELGSRWTWLQLRVAELEGRIRQFTKLHKNIRSTKGCVVLADSQPMRDKKNARLRETAGFSGTALDGDNEPCSPTRLLHNIERQSAQLSKIVNSLMPPLNLSPLSRPSQLWEDKRAFNSDVFVSGSSKRRNFSVKRRQLFKDDLSCVCARTRPLVTYNKPTLFRLNFVCNNKSSMCSSRLSGLTSSSCSCCSSSCDPLLLSSDMDGVSNGTLSSKTCSSNTGDSSVLSRFTKGSAREEWSQIPLVINALPLSPVHYRRCSSTPLYNSHKHRQHYKKRVLGLSPIRQHDCVRRKHKRVHQRKRKRCRRDSITEDSYWEDSSDDMFEENNVFVSQKQSTGGVVHRHHGESMFNIDNIPASVTKVEKLQYKDILTPSWQVVDIQALMKNEADSEKGKDEQIEILTDAVFAQRHLPLEQKEKQRWSFWGKRRYRHSSRSGSRLSSCSGVLEENSVEWSFTRLDTDEQLSTEECLPQAPWEHRVFPLNEDDEQALSSEVLQWCSTCTLSSSTSLNSDLIVFQSTDTTPPSYGHYMDCTDSEL